MIVLRQLKSQSIVLPKTRDNSDIVNVIEKLTKVLLMANVIPAWFGATSTWLLKCPAELKADSIIQTVMTLTSACSMFDAVNVRFRSAQKGPRKQNSDPTVISWLIYRDNRIVIPLLSCRRLTTACSDEKASWPIGITASWCDNE